MHQRALTLFLACIFISLLFFLAPASAAPAPVILDTDIGTDCDDLMALIYILSRPDLFDLRLVQASTYNTDQRAQIVAKILDTLNRIDVPIGIGYTNGNQFMPEYPWAQSYSLDTFKAKGGKIIDGTSAMLAEMQKATPTNPTYIIEIAPANSLGDILLTYPDLAKNCICVAMSGSVYRGYLDSPTRTVEYNVDRNISSSQAMYNSPWLQPLVTAPLDTTNFDQWNGTLYHQLITANNSAHPFVQVLLENYQVWYDNGGKSYGALLPFSPSMGTSVMYDPQAAWMTGKIISHGGYESLKMQSLNLYVNDQGYTLADASKQPRIVNSAIGFDTSQPYMGSDVIGSEIIQSIKNPVKRKINTK